MLSQFLPLRQFSPNYTRGCILDFRFHTFIWISAVSFSLLLNIIPYVHFTQNPQIFQSFYSTSKCAKIQWLAYFKWALYLLTPPLHSNRRKPSVDRLYFWLIIWLMSAIKLRDVRPLSPRKLQLVWMAAVIDPERSYYLWLNLLKEGSSHRPTLRSHGVS